MILVFSVMQICYPNTSLTIHSLRCKMHCKIVFLMNTLLLELEMIKFFAIRVSGTLLMDGQTFI